MKSKIVYIIVAVIYTFNLAFYPFLYGLSNDVNYLASADESSEINQNDNEGESPEENKDEDKEDSNNDSDENNDNEDKDDEGDNDNSDEDENKDDEEDEDKDENENNENSDEEENQADEEDESDENKDNNNSENKPEQSNSNNKNEDNEEDDDSNDSNGDENKDEEDNNNENNEDESNENNDENNNEENNEEPNNEGDVLPAQSFSIQPLAVGTTEPDTEPNTDFPTEDECFEEGKKITICHATGSESNPYVQLTLSCNALYGGEHGGGHLDENGNPLEGHEDDVLPGEDGLCPGQEEEQEYGGIKILKKVIPDDGSEWNFEIEGKSDLEGIDYEINGLAHNESETIEDVPVGDYEITELNVPEGTHVNVTCSDGTKLDPVHWDIEVFEGEITECIVENELKVDEGTIEITKNVYPEDQSKWDFQVTGPNDYDEGLKNLKHEDSETLTELLPGSYTITELNVPSDYTTSIECDNDESSASNTITFDLEEGEDVKCNVNNRKKIEEEVGSIRIVKDIEPYDDTVWDFRLEGPNGIQYVYDLGDEQGETLSDLPFGDYILTEINLHDDYTTSVSCDNGEDTVSEEIKFNLDSEELVTCTFLNEKEEEPKTITVIKDVKPEDDGSAWDFQLTNDNGYDQKQYDLYDDERRDFKDLESGTYTLQELKVPEGYEVSIVCDNDTKTSGDSINIELADEDVTCTFTNRKTPEVYGTISGFKFEDKDWNNQFDNLDERFNDWPIVLYDENWNFVDRQLTSPIIGIGEFNFDQLQLGSYYVCEEQRKEGLQTYPYIGIPNAVANQSGELDEAEYCYQVTLDREISDYENANFGNVKGGRVEGYKFYDENNNSEYDEETRLNNWTINLLNDDFEIIKSEETGMMDKTGYYEFNTLERGRYYVCEVLEDNWIQTYPFNLQERFSVNNEIDLSQCWEINVESPGDEFTKKDFGNYQELESELSIQKYNNVNNGATISKRGDNVLYTIIVTARNGNPLNVSVVDLPPGGFKYLSGSWTANSNDRGDLRSQGITTEPTYASPGTWQLGDMKEGEVVTLTYLAKISNDVETGKYRDLAWAQSDNEETKLLAYAEPTGYVDEYFVGTAATVETPKDSPDASVKIDEETEEVEIEEEVQGQVLGATTLPATGSNTYLLLIGFLSVIIGIALIKGSNSMSKLFTSFKVIIFAYALLMILLSGISKAYAASTDISVRIQTPESSLNQPFTLNFVALDIEGRSVTAECYKKAPGEGTFTKFDSTKNLSAGGNSSYCNVTQTILSSNGSYEFKVIASANGDVAESDTVSVSYNKTDKPDKPKYLDVDRDGSCKYNIEFKTADDGKTDYVELYISDELEFDISSSNVVRTINIGPNTKYDDYYEVGSSDCGKEWYFAVRAFDQYGNASDFTAQDDIVKTEEKIVTVEVDGETYTGTITTQAAATSNVEGVSSYQPSEDVIVDTEGDQTDNEGDGDVLGDEDTTEEPEGRKSFLERLFGLGDDEEEDNGEGDGSVLGDQDNDENQTEKKNWFLRFIAFLISIFRGSDIQDTEIVVPEDGVSEEKIFNFVEEENDEAMEEQVLGENSSDEEMNNDDNNQDEMMEEDQNNNDEENNEDMDSMEVEDTEYEGATEEVQDSQSTQTTQDNNRGRFLWWLLPILAIVLIIYLARHVDEE